MRLDKFLCDTAGLTRTEAKKAVKKGQIAVNGQVQKAADFKVKENTDTVTFQGKPLSYAVFHYYMLHKPAGVITATEDKKENTVMDILREEKVKICFPWADWTRTRKDFFSLPTMASLPITCFPQRSMWTRNIWLK